MYGTVARMRIKPGHMDQIMEMTKRWDQERSPSAEGFVASYVYRLDRDSDEAILVAVFEDQERYRANASDPEQDRWYQEMRAHLEDDPEWNDGEIVYSQTQSRREPAM